MERQQSLLISLKLKDRQQFGRKDVRLGEIIWLREHVACHASTCD